MSGADRIVSWSTAVAVLGVAAVAAVASYERAYDLVRAHGETGWTARMVPLTVDGLIYASSMVMLDSARRKMPVPALSRWLLGLGIAATLAANVAHGLGHGLVGTAVAAWPAVALVGSYELLMMAIRSAQVPADGTPDTLHGADSLQEQAAQFPRCALSARSSTSASPGHSGCGTTSLRELQGRRKVRQREQLAGTGVKPTVEARGQLQRASSRRSNLVGILIVRTTAHRCARTA